jgi:predicted PurR-regulated permease PerM
MGDNQLRNTALWLAIIALSVWLLERLFVVLSFFATPLLLFGLSWLLSLVLQPIVRSLTAIEFMLPLTVQRSFGIRPAAATWHMPKALAVPLVFLGVIAFLSVFAFALVPAIGPQLTRLGEAMPTVAPILTGWTQSVDTQLQRIGVRADLTGIIEPQALTQQIGAIGTSLVQQSLGIASGIANLLFNAFLVLIISFYITLDAERIGLRIIRSLPEHWREEALTLFQMVDRVFGGFLRAQLLQSVIFSAATAVVMALLGIPDVTVASLLAGVLIAIPLIGSLFAVIPPVLVVLVISPDRLLFLLVLLFIAQQILFNVVMPRLMGKSVGLHPLLVFAAMLVGATVAGPWGLLFGIPVAGVAASVLQFAYQRAGHRAAPGELSG